MKEAQTAQNFETNYKNMIVSIESRESNDDVIAETLTLKYSKIGIFEKVFNLENPFVLKSKFFLAFSQVEYVHEDHSINVIFHDLEDPSRKLSINGRDKNEIQLGYNSKGDIINIKTCSDLPLEVNQVNKVYLTAIDVENKMNFFYLGREKNTMKGYKDENKRTAFYMFLIAK